MQTANRSDGLVATANGLVKGDTTKMGGDRMDEIDAAMRVGEAVVSSVTF